jgi:hypothetical protein
MPMSMPMKRGLSWERANELFSYDPDVGQLIRKIPRGRGRRSAAGVVAGTPTTKGYRLVSIDGCRYLEHRVIWLMVHGYFPENQIDHIDRDPANNRIANLREVSQSCNMRNSSASCLSVSGIKGVYPMRGRWVATLRSDGCKNSHVYFGTDYAEAVAHRLAAEQALGYEVCDMFSEAQKFMLAYVSGSVEDVPKLPIPILADRAVSSCVGVYFDRSTRKWVSQIRLPDRHATLYYGDSEIEAVLHRKAAEQCMNQGETQC